MKCYTYISQKYLGESEMFRGLPSSHEDDLRDVSSE